MKKNTAGQYLPFYLVDIVNGGYVLSDETASLSIQISKDGGTFAAGAGAFTESKDKDGNRIGRFLYALSQADTNGDQLGYYITHSNSNYRVEPIEVVAIVAQTGDAYAVVTNATYGNSALHTEVAKDATVSKPGTAQTITAADTANATTAQATIAKLETMIESV